MRIVFRNLGIGMAAGLCLGMAAVGCRDGRTQPVEAENPGEHTWKQAPPDFSIAVGLASTPLPADPGSIRILQQFDWRDITDCPASFVADPFLFHHRERWYLFFEILNAASNKGDIGVATSDDGHTWQYEGIVLSESFHLSYPFVFEHAGQIYMVPESARGQGVFLYEATDFPRGWKRQATLLDQPLRDPTLLHHDGRWWMFASDASNRMLELYVSDELASGWQRHPQSPVVRNDANIARCGGRISSRDGTLYRVAQDCAPAYGNQVRLFRVDTLTTHAFAQTELPESPLLKGGDYPWASAGMHHLSVEPYGPAGHNQWLVAFDGHSSGRPDVPLDIAFSGNHTLSGISVRPHVLRPGDACLVRMFWKEPPPLEEGQELAAFVHVQQGRNRIFQADQAWPRHRRVTETLVRVPEDAPEGSYHIVCGLYDPVTGRRSRVKGSLRNSVKLPITLQVGP